MTTFATRFNRAANWSARLPIARDIFTEIRAEASGVPLVESLPVVAQAVDTWDVVKDWTAEGSPIVEAKQGGLF